ncbi:MAG: iron-sulfur cluster assembly accessory protein [Candidatus Aenigmarchaeota archaeon]|nr:iron-sulfur cluster assembly accessory protein [Candidatus Aenigmarchaeota archaeon]
MAITKEAKIRDFLMKNPSLSRILVENGITAALINKNILNSLEETARSLGLENQLDKIVNELNQKLEEKAELKNKPKPGKILTITPLAAERIKSIMASKGMSDYSLKFGIVSAGCATYVYDMDFEKKPTNDEIVIEESGLKVIIAKKSLPLIEGCRIDYIESSRGFKIENPNTKSGN